MTKIQQRKYAKPYTFCTICGQNMTALILDMQGVKENQPPQYTCFILTGGSSLCCWSQKGFVTRESPAHNEMLNFETSDYTHMARS
jgi:hypothetical protein